MAGVDAGVILAVITGLAGLVVALATRRRTDAETNKATVEAIVLLLSPLSARVKSLEEEVATLRTRVADFRRGVELLCGQVRELGAEPVWLPEDCED